MNWITLIPIIAQYGLPLAQKLWEKWHAGGAPTQADWDELTALSRQTARTQMMLALARAGVDPNSAEGQALLAAVS